MEFGPVDQKEMLFKILFLSRALVAPLFGGLAPVVQILVDGIMKNSVNVF